jgi:hypothetical protein
MPSQKSIIVCAIVLVCVAGTMVDAAWNNRKLLAREERRAKVGNYTLFQSWETITTSQTASLEDFDGYILDSTSNAITLTIPDLDGWSGTVFGMKRKVSNLQTVTIQMQSGQTIDGMSSRQLTAATMGSFNCLVDGEDFIIVSSH